MTWTTLTLALVVLLAGPLRTDTTLVVQPGMRLQLESFAGQVFVRAWRRNALRVEANHLERAGVDIKLAGPVVRVNAAVRRDIQRKLGEQVVMPELAAVDYQISVPEWMPVAITGLNTAITIEGVRAPLQVETVKGDVMVTGGDGLVRLGSVEGLIRLAGARGRTFLSSVNNGIRVRDVAGTLNVETVNGDIDIEKTLSDSVEATSVNGLVRFLGAIQARGRYRLATHNGDVVVVVPDQTNAAFDVSTFNGAFETSIPVRLSELRRGRRFKFVLGTGGAEFDLESFQGTIMICRPSEPCSHKEEE